MLCFSILLALELLCRLKCTACFGLNDNLQVYRLLMVKDSAAPCNAVFFLPILVASGYFWLGWLLVVAFGFVWFTDCGCLECAGAGVLLCAGRPP